jgi:hypothetical protein
MMAAGLVQGSYPGYIHPAGVIFAFQGNHRPFLNLVNTKHQTLK